LDEKRRAARRRALARPLARKLGAPPTKRHRFAARVLMLRAWLGVLFGALEAAGNLAERANQADPGWLTPLKFLGNMWQRAGLVDRAVAAYRRALNIASTSVAQSPREMTRIASAYLELAHRLVAQGHPDRARALLDELSLHDLSRAQSHLRLALRRQRRRLALNGGEPSELELSPP
jgi:Tfp pilus assembly protein PilF